MNTERYQQLLNSYGTNIDRWPENERHYFGEFQLEHEAAEAILVDNLLAKYPEQETNLTALEQSIFTETIFRRTALDLLITWLKPTESMLRPALVTSLPLIVGLMFGFTLELDDTYSLDEEISIMGLSSQLEGDYE